MLVRPNRLMTKSSNNANITSSSMAMDFITGSLDPKVTFSRASNATVTNSSGNIVYAPHNLLTFSEQFDNAAWTKARTTITANNTAAPDGTTTADKLIEDTSASTTHLFQQNFSCVAGFTYSTSIYIKASERNTIRIQFPSTGFGVNVIWSFNAALGSVTPIAGTTGTTASITPVGNGWYRCQLTAVATLTATVSLQMFMVNELNQVTYTGDGVSGIFIWGAQLNVGSLQSYNPTTVKNLLGFSEQFDNAAWTKSNSFIQTNLLTFSEQFDNAAWTKTRASITANSALAPNSSTTADKLVIDTTAATNHWTGQNYSVTSGITYTYSVYAKAEQYSEINLRFSAQFPAGNVYFNLSNGTLTNSGTLVDSSITNVGNGWYRCSISQTANATGTATAQVFLASAGSITIATANGTDGLLLWGAQLVQGSVAGNYQQTTSSALAVMYQDPNGTLTADKLVEDTVNTSHFTNVTPTVVTNTPYVFSVYAKQGERRYFRIQNFNASGDVELAVFDLQTGTIVSQSGTTESQIISVGNGWYRCSVPLINNTDTGSNISIQLYQTSTTASYTGDGTSGIYIWGAQLSDSASLDQYVNNPVAAPSSTAYYGPRFDYDPVTLQPLGLLIEEQRTNTIRNNSGVGAVVGTTTLPTNWTYTGGGLTATVVGSGSESGINYVDIQFAGTTSSTSAGLRFEGSAGVTASTGQVWTGSMYIRRVAGATTNFSTIGLSLQGLVSGVIADQSAITITNDLNATSISLFRPTTTVTLSTASTTTVRPQVLFTFSSGVAIDITLRIGFPQLELGAFATSVIPTTTAQVTRSADVALIQGSNFSSWYNVNEGTVSANFSAFANSTNRYVIDIEQSASANSRIDININTSNVINPRTVVSGSAIASLTGGTYTVNSLADIAFAYKVIDYASSFNGATAVTATTAGVLPSDLARMYIGSLTGSGSLNGHIRQLAYYPRRLQNSELQAITQ